MIKHHPHDRAERLALKRKYSLKQTRRYGSEAASNKGLSDEYPGTIHATTKNSTTEEGHREETDIPRVN